MHGSMFDGIGTVIGVYAVLIFLAGAGLVGLIWWVWG